MHDVREYLCGAALLAERFLTLGKLAAIMESSLNNMSLQPTALRTSNLTDSRCSKYFQRSMGNKITHTICFD